MTAALPDNPPVLLIEELIDRDTCAALIEHWHSGRRFEGPVSTGQGARVAKAAAKIREDAMVGPGPLLETLKQAVASHLIPAVMSAFQFRITQFESFRVGCYDSTRGGFFRAHRDNTSPFTRHRKFALSLNLNAGDYTGGCLHFPEFAAPPFDAPSRTGIVFPCTLLHEAQPVTSGRRFGMFGFFYDDAGAALVESYQEAGRVPGY
jgi:predicted 2-oxoglutarate/Fe(II)-dependent dioxygenase YbiX